MVCEKTRRTRSGLFLLPRCCLWPASPRGPGGGPGTRSNTEQQQDRRSRAPGTLLARTHKIQNTKARRRFFVYILRYKLSQHARGRASQGTMVCVCVLCPQQYECVTRRPHECVRPKAGRQCANEMIVGCSPLMRRRPAAPPPAAPHAKPALSCEGSGLYAGLGMLVTRFLVACSQV